MDEWEGGEQGTRQKERSGRGTAEAEGSAGQRETGSGTGHRREGSSLAVRS